VVWRGLLIGAEAFDSEWEPWPFCKERAQGVNTLTSLSSLLPVSHICSHWLNPLRGREKET